MFWYVAENPVGCSDKYGKIQYTIKGVFTSLNQFHLPFKNLAMKLIVIIF